MLLSNPPVMRDVDLRLAVAYVPGCVCLLKVVLLEVLLMAADQVGVQGWYVCLCLVLWLDWHYQAKEAVIVDTSSVRHSVLCPSPVIESLLSGMQSRSAGSPRGDLRNRSMVARLSSGLAMRARIAASLSRHSAAVCPKNIRRDTGRDTPDALPSQR